jgi:enoyl-CoA hydratase/carnithine racemase
MTDLVGLRVTDGVAVVTLDNPPMNLVTLALTRRLGEVVAGLAADPEVRVMVLAGGGERAFCAGSDIKEFAPLVASGRVIETKLRPENAVYSAIDDLPLPTIAAVQGLAYGGGLELAVCCDLIVVEEGARLALPETRLGVFPGSGGTVRVTRRIGEGRAKEMMYLGDPIDAPTALAWGLVNRVVAKGQALAVAEALAARLAAQPGRALQLCKQAIDLSFDLTEDAAVARGLTLSEAVFATEDCREGQRAFLAKETPRFRHR